MKRTAALLFITTFAFSAFCGVEYKFNEKDKFTGNVKFKTQPVIIHKRLEPLPKTVHKDVGIAVKYQDSLKVLCVEYVLWKGANMFLNYAAGNSATILFDDGSSIDLPVIGALPNVFKYTFEHEFYINEANSEILKNKKITDIRFNAQINGYDMTIPEAKREEIRELIKLFPASKKNDDIEKENTKKSPGSI